MGSDSVALRLPLALLIASTAAWTQAPVPAKLQALIITGQNGHDWRAVTPLLRKTLEDTGRFEVRITEEFRGATAASLAPYDLVIVNYFDRNNKNLWWGEATQSAFLDYVRSGKGLVIYHFSVAAFNGWEQWEKMCGGNWRPNQGHHSAKHSFNVDITDSDHPITKGLKKKLAQPDDELYANLKWQPKEGYRILATAYDDHALYNGKARQPIPGPGIDQPMLWVSNYGSGRIFVTALGHDAPAVSTATFQVTFTRGAEWAATGAVTSPVPPELQ